MAKVSPMCGALTDEEFCVAAARFPRMSERALEAAHAVLVDGRTQENVATAMGLTRQLLQQWASKLYNAFRPDGWITETVTLPTELMEQVRQMERDARAELEASRPEPRITRR